MKKLYGIIAKFNNSDTKRSCAFYVDSAEEAKNEFLRDCNHRARMHIEKIIEITSSACIVYLQIGREVPNYVETHFQLREAPRSRQYYNSFGRGSFFITIPPILDKNGGDIEFEPFDCHCSENGQLELMICLANGMPNWLY